MPPIKQNAISLLYLFRFAVRICLLMPRTSLLFLFSLILIDKFVYTSLLGPVHALTPVFVSYNAVSSPSAISLINMVREVNRMILISKKME